MLIKLIPPVRFEPISPRFIIWFKLIFGINLAYQLISLKRINIDLPNDVTSPTIEEIKTTLRQIKSWKVLGPENIPSEDLNSDTGDCKNFLRPIQENLG